MDANISLCGTVPTETLNLIDFFRFALKYPGAEQFDVFRKPQFAEGLREMWHDLLPDAASPEFEAPAALEDLEADYAGLFDVGAPHPPCPLVESHYVKNAPVSSVLLENKLFFLHFGFDHKDGGDSPDHLLAQLEFLACLDYLLETAPESEREALELGRREYLERHVLHWLPKAVQELDKTSPTVYHPLLRLLEWALRLDGSDAE